MDKSTYTYQYLKGLIYKRKKGLPETDKPF